MSGAVALTEQSVAWDLRGRWAAGRRVVVTLTERCMVARVEGVVEYVSVTGAFAIVDGHAPVRIYRCPTCGWWHTTAERRPARTAA